MFPHGPSYDGLIYLHGRKPWRMEHSESILASKDAFVYHAAVGPPKRLSSPIDCEKGFEKKRIKPKNKNKIQRS